MKTKFFPGLAIIGSCAVLALTGMTSIPNVGTTDQTTTRRSASVVRVDSRTNDAPSDAADATARKVEMLGRMHAPMPRRTDCGSGDAISDMARENSNETVETVHTPVSSSRLR